MIFYLPFLSTNTKNSKLLTSPLFPLSSASFIISNHSPSFFCLAIVLRAGVDLDRVLLDLDNADAKYQDADDPVHHQHRPADLGHRGAALHLPDHPIPVPLHLCGVPVLHQRLLHVVRVSTGQELRVHHSRARPIPLPCAEPHRALTVRKSPPQPLPEEDLHEDRGVAARRDPRQALPLLYHQPHQQK